MVRSSSWVLDQLLNGLGVRVVVLQDHRVRGESAGVLRHLPPRGRGMPTTVAPAGTAFTTTEFEPMRAPSPTVKPPRILAPPPTTTPAPERRVALRAALERGAAQRHALVDGAAVADFRGLADHHAHAVVDEHAARRSSRRDGSRCR